MPRVVRTLQAALLKAQAVVTLTIGLGVKGWEVVKNAKDVSNNKVDDMCKHEISALR